MYLICILVSVYPRWIQNTYIINHLYCKMLFWTDDNSELQSEIITLEKEEVANISLREESDQIDKEKHYKEQVAQEEKEITKKNMEAIFKVILETEQYLVEKQKANSNEINELARKIDEIQITLNKKRKQDEEVCTNIMFLIVIKSLIFT